MEVGDDPHDSFTRGVRDGRSTGHHHAGVRRERVQQLSQCVIMEDRVGVQDRDNLSLSTPENLVEARGLAPSLRLANEESPWVPILPLSDDSFRSICTPARDHDDLDQFELWRDTLEEQGLKASPDTTRLVEGTNADSHFHRRRISTKK